MLYLSAYIQVGWLNVQDLWLVVHNSKGSQWQPRPQTYAILSQKRICRNLRVFSNNKCPLFTRLGGWGVAERGQFHLFLPFFFIARLPLELFFFSIYMSFFGSQIHKKIARGPVCHWHADDYQMVLNQHCWLFTLHVPFEVKLRTQTMFSLFVSVKPFQMLNWSFLGVGTHVSQPCVPTPHHHHQRHVSQPRWWPTSYGLNELSIGPKLFLKYLRNKKALKTLK